MNTFPTVLFKLSGESLSSGGPGVDGLVVKKLAKQLAAVNKKGIALAIVVGGGNIWRFRDKQHLTIPRVESDYLGMLATIFNAVALTEALKAAGSVAIALSAVAAPKELIAPYKIPAAKKVLQAGGIVVLAGGTGKPFVTTDSGAAMRASELKASHVLKATTVDGVYDSDPRKNTQAKKFTTLTYKEALAKKLAVMDEKAFQILGRAKIPTIVFNFDTPGLFLRAARGENVGTMIQ